MKKPIILDKKEQEKAGNWYSGIYCYGRDTDKELIHRAEDLAEKLGIAGNWKGYALGIKLIYKELRQVSGQL